MKLSWKRLNLKFSFRCFSMNRLFFALSSDGIRLNISSIYSFLSGSYWEMSSLYSSMMDFWTVRTSLRLLCSMYLLTAAGMPPTMRYSRKSCMSLPCMTLSTGLPSSNDSRNAPNTLSCTPRARRNSSRSRGYILVAAAAFLHQELDGSYDLRAFLDLIKKYKGLPGD